MDVVFNSIYARACMGAGLAVLSGVRAFLPIAFLALYSRLAFASAPVLDDTPFAFLHKTWVLILFFVLAVAELVMDKFPKWSHTRDQVMQPIKIVLGGLVFAAVMAPEGWISMTVCGILGLVIAGLADNALRSLRPPVGADTGPAIFMSIYADVIVLIGTLLFVLVPLIGALLALFLFLLVYRIRRRQTRKHRGLRILRG
ncbi:MAG: DUF4126 domain-containing protein [Actinobacteria bacterium]|nr:DUF4126 domain-containing protein [Actinomycetota bacterium]